jgi:hypothetical protein
MKDFLPAILGGVLGLRQGCGYRPPRNDGLNRSNLYMPNDKHTNGDPALASMQWKAAGLLCGQLDAEGYMRVVLCRLFEIPNFNEAHVYAVKRI